VLFCSPTLTAFTSLLEGAMQVLTTSGSGFRSANVAGALDSGFGSASMLGAGDGVGYAFSVVLYQSSSTRKVKLRQSDNFFSDDSTLVSTFKNLRQNVHQNLHQNHHQNFHPSLNQNLL
jgi:hypothetical protein